jgi:two-component system, NtrC family, response regulator HydG
MKQSVPELTALLAESQELAGVGSWELDLASGRLVWSDQMFRILGFEPQAFEPSPEKYFSLVHPEDRTRVQQAIEGTLRTCSSFDHEERVLCPDGSERIHHSRGRVVCDELGRPARLVGACQDVTELRRAEQEREQVLVREHQARLESDASRRKFSGILERISDAFVSLDSEWRYIHVNEKAGKLLGRRPEDLIGKHIWSEFPEGVGQKFYHAYHQAMRDQAPVYLEDFYPPFNRWFENRIYPSKDGLSIFFTDITERRLAEDALRTSQERFREIAETIVEAFWVVSADLKTLRYLSPAFETIFGIPPAPLDEARDAWIAAIHPDDRQEVLDTFARGPDGPLGGIYRFHRPDGTLRWCRWRGFPVRDSSGALVRITGFSEDITDLKETEEALRGAQLRLSESLRDTQDRVVQLEEQVRTRASFGRLVGKSGEMQEAYRRIRLAAQSDVTVLLTGESGTGKELAASAIHSMSERRSGPFVAVNCAAIPEALLESELFGHVKGSFTGAIRDKVGLFQSADGGTLFLDEVGDMSSALQVRVLRALQEREVRRLGDDRVSKVDVRLVSATNRDLSKLLATGKLREDFYYRIRVFEIRLPPLRDRRDDIPLLVRHFLEQISARSPRASSAIDAAAMRALMDYPWPGNVRELQNAIEHAFVTAAGLPITLDHLPSEMRRRPSVEKVLNPRQAAERERLVEALKKTGWNRTKAAELLGTSRVTVWKKMRRFGVQSD